MNYWHMQLHPSNPNWGREKEVLEKYSIIGFGPKEGDETIVGDFTRKMQIGDIVAIKNGQILIALAQVAGSCVRQESNEQDNLNWFTYKRNVQILAWNIEKLKLPQPRGTLSICNDFSKPTSKVIVNWHRQVIKNKMNEEIIQLIEHKKQIILQGPPGTGKTYSAKDLAEQLIYGSISSDKKAQKIKLEKSGQFALVQFHPSYSYEDFVRGITATTEGESITYQAENKLLATFAKKASDNLKAVNQDVKVYSKEKAIEALLMQFVGDVQDHLAEKDDLYSITEAVSIYEVVEDAFRYKGNWQTAQRMKFEDLIKAQLHGATERQDLKQLNDVSGLVKHHASYYIKVINKFQEKYKKELTNIEKENISQEKPELKNYVLIIDEINRANLPSVLGELIYALEYRDVAIESMYAVDGDNKITLPNNLYIIGTMNTADRSVGHIDYAIKRRFAFVEMLPKAEVVTEGKAKTLFNQVSELFVKEENGKPENSDHLASDFDYKDVQLGHSYFILKEGTEEQQKQELKMRLTYEIVPILNEYVKDGLLLETALPKIEEISRFEP